MGQIEKKVRAFNQSNVKICGRHLFDSEGILWLTSSAAYVEFRTTCCHLTLNIKGDVTACRDKDGNSQGNCARFAVYINGNLDSIVNVDQKDLSVNLVESSKALSLAIKIIKLTESSQSYLGLKSLETDQNASIEAEPQKPLKIEFIGDSITCGYGVDTTKEEDPFSTLTEDATKTYAWHTARELNADCMFSSYSSFGVHSGWTDSGDLNDFSLVPKIYGNTCFSWNTTMFSNIQWDFNLFTPHIVIINLGTNDVSYCFGHGNEESREKAFIQSYVEFTKRIRELYPNAIIIASIGIMKMGNPMWPLVNSAVKEYKKISGDNNIHFLHFNPQTKEEGFGSGQHPTAQTQNRCGKELVEYLKSLNIIPVECS